MDPLAKECIDRMKATEKKLYSFMTPDYVATIAYNAHAAGKMGQDNPLTKSVAEQEVALFVALKSDLTTASGRFLHKVRSEFVSLANGISNCKRDYLEHVGDINMQFADKEDKLNHRWFKRGTWKAINRIAVMSGFATIGASFARAIVPVFSTETTMQTGVYLPTIGASILAGWIGYSFFEWWNEHQRNRVAEARRFKLSNARKERDNERLHVLVKHLERLHVVWYDYIGIEYWIPVEASYARIIKDDMDVSDMLERQYELRNMSKLRLVFDTCSTAIKKLTKKDQKEAA